jgi:hypothetical protein
MKRDLEANPRDPKVSKIYKDELAAQSYALKLSDSYDVVMMKIDTDLFSMDYQINQGSVYYGLGILDVVFYPKKRSLNDTMGSKASSTGYSKRTTNYGTHSQSTPSSNTTIPDPPILHAPTHGVWWNVWHNCGVIIRFGAVCFLFYAFAAMIQDASITVSLPAGSAGTSTYDVGHGAKHVADVSYHAGMIAYQHITDYAVQSGLVDKFNELWNN